MLSTLRRHPEWLLILAGAWLRLVPHWPNFTPVGGLALLGGATIASLGGAVALPLLSLFLSDLVIGFHPYVFFTYSAFLLIVLVGRLVRPFDNPSRLIPASLGASSIFFLVSNLGVWFRSFPHTGEGLTACFTAALPFAWSTFAGDLFYTAVFFALWQMVNRPSIATARVAAETVEARSH